MLNKAVVIMGMRGPYEDPLPEGTEIWGPNRAYIHQPNLTRLFQMHKLKNYESNWISEDGEEDLLKHTIAAINSPEMKDCRFITLQKYDPIPKSEVYPLREILKHFSFIPQDFEGSLNEIVETGPGYFTSCMAYMIALAIYEGFTEITLHRLICTEGSAEYFGQKACIEFWIGVAMGLGIQIRISQDSSLLKPPQWETSYYGYKMVMNYPNATHTLVSATNAIDKMDTSQYRVVDLDEVEQEEIKNV